MVKIRYLVVPSLFWPLFTFYFLLFFAYTWYNFYRGLRTSLSKIGPEVSESTRVRKGIFKYSLLESVQIGPNRMDHIGQNCEHEMLFLSLFNTAPFLIFNLILTKGKCQFVFAFSFLYEISDLIILPGWRNMVSTVQRETYLAFGVFTTEKTSGRETLYRSVKKLHNHEHERSNKQIFNLWATNEW